MTRISGDLTIKQKWKIGIVTAKFNSSVTEKLEAAAIQRLEELGLRDEQLVTARVPGAVEIPLAAKAFLENGCDGVVALGAVIRGETSHYDYVCSSVERGCTELQLKFGKPVSFGVLTTENADQAHARAGGHKGNKGSEAVDVTIEMLNVIEGIKNQANDKKGEKYE